MEIINRGLGYGENRPSKMERAEMRGGMTMGGDDLGYGGRDQYKEKNITSEVGFKQKDKDLIKKLITASGLFEWIELFFTRKKVKANDKILISHEMTEELADFLFTKIKEKLNN